MRPGLPYFHCSLRKGEQQSRRQCSRLRGASVYQGGQSLKLSTKAVVFKRVSLLIGGGSQACRLRGAGTPGTPWCRPWSTGSLKVITSPDAQFLAQNQVKNKRKDYHARRFSAQNWVKNKKKGYQVQNFCVSMTFFNVLRGQIIFC